MGKFLVQDDYLFKGRRLYILRSSLHNNLIKQLHSSNLSRHIGGDKTIVGLEELNIGHNWTQMLKVHAKVSYVSYQKGTTIKHMFIYMPLFIANTYCDDFSIDSMLGLLKMQRRNDSMFFMVDWFSKMLHFIPC